MGDFEDKLNSILSSPETMGQIMALANSLGGGDPKGSDSQGDPSPQPRPAAQTSSPDLSALLSALGGGETPSPSGLGSLDPAMLSALISLMGEYNREDDRKTALLLALKPFLREERWARVDRAVQIARLSRVIRMAAQLFKGGTDV